MAPLADRHNRIATNLRVSVTDVCNLRCLYCMTEKMDFVERSEIMTFDEIVRLVGISVSLGVNKVRLTGGEPLVRKNLPELVENLFAIRGLTDVSLTTNGIGLASQAQKFYDVGLRRINISLDSLSEVKFAQITRRNLLGQVLDGLEEARQVGFDPIKINAVPMRGFTEDEVLDLVEFARNNGYEMRFIEFMPLDADNIWGQEMFIPNTELKDRIGQAFPLQGEEDGRRLHATAKDYWFRDGKGKIGFISSVTEPFCHDCNRVRLTADGKFRNCLFALEETDLLTPLRHGATDLHLADLMRQSVADKAEGHLINSQNYIKPKRNMSMIGG
ncbi:MAG: GTP 3',8-cyclase MoaA [Candidatus Poribacteria bacterium]|nr:GTP 3',8-cyclase MoaA [Candidatus Poribacteria bacterium]